MANLTRKALHSSSDIATRQQCSTYPRPQCDEPCILHTSQCAETKFCEQRTRGVIVDLHIDTKFPTEWFCDRQMVCAREIRRRMNDTFSSNQTGHTDSYRGTTTKIRHDVRETRNEIFRTWRGEDFLRDDFTINADADAVTLRATNVYAYQSSQDSRRALSSFNVLRIRFSARRFTKPGKGSTSSISRP